MVVREEVRKRGIHQGIADEVDEILFSQFLGTRASQLVGSVLDFLVEQTAKVPKGGFWIGSSEIIESLFGKIKHLEQDQSKGGFTSLVLAGAACLGKLDEETVAQALTTTKVKDILEWEKNNIIGGSLQARRCKALKKQEHQLLAKITIDSGQDLSGFSQGLLTGTG